MSCLGEVLQPPQFETLTSATVVEVMEMQGISLFCFFKSCVGSHCLEIFYHLQAELAKQIDQYTAEKRIIRQICMPSNHLWGFV